jgi:UDP-N-acetylglucosamine--N-acetylmuramyl-(pentapeptide) pyrophosphoryl-undecaprenol N-acetylglucosamine transferase
LTGNPIRREFFLIGATPPPDKGKKLNLLVMAGEQGARTINYTMIAALDHLKGYRDALTFTHQTGAADFEYVKAGYERRDFRAEVHQYIRDIPRMYAKAHLVIARSGTSTVSELKASGRPAILVPYPHDDNHQEANALALKDAGLAQIIAQSQFSGRSLAQEIIRVLEHPEELAQAWSYSRSFQEQDATTDLLQACLHLAKDAGANGFDI